MYEENPYRGIEYLGFLGPESIGLGQTVRMRVTLRNASQTTLTSRDGIFLSYRFVRSSADREEPWGSGLWTVVEEAIRPGETASLYPLVTVPEIPGQYLLEFDFVQNQVCWFHDKGATILHIPLCVKVENPPKDEEVHPTRGWAGLFKQRRREIGAGPLDYFVILGMQRSGTSILHANVGDHPQIECLTGELKVSPLFTSGVDILTNRPCDTVLELEQGWKHIFRGVCALNNTKDTRLCGAKVAVDDVLAAMRLVSAISRTYPELKVIVVERRDRVAQFGSLQCALSTGVFCSSEGNGKCTPVSLDEGEFRTYCQSVKAINRELTRLDLSNPFYRCYYEDLLKDGNAFMAGVYRFLGVKTIPFQARLKKLLPTPEEYILNCQALRQIEAAEGLKAAGPAEGAP